MKRAIRLYGVLIVLFLLVGFFQSWSVALAILNLCLISAVMALGVNIQWGYAGLFNAGIMGFAAIGGVVALLIGHAPVSGAIEAGGAGVALSFIVLVAGCSASGLLFKYLKGVFKYALPAAVLIGTFVLFRQIFVPARVAIESYDPAASGFMGGLGLPILLSWPLAGLAAAGAAFLIGKVALGLRSDYLAIATLGISEIIVAIVKNENWLTRGVKNATGLPQPVPDGRLLQEQTWLVDLVTWMNRSSLDALPAAEQTAALRLLIAEASSIIVKLVFAGLFAAVLAGLLTLCVLALNSPWGRMIRAIRDNETAAGAMGKDVAWRHLQILMLGSAVVGMAGAMLVTLDGQLTPAAYIPLRYTFLIWVMVIVGGSGSNVGSVFGAFLIWFVWVQSEPLGYWVVKTTTSWMSNTSPIRAHLLEQAQYFRVLMMGTILLLVLRFHPQGFLPERPGRNRQS
ncbi:branched-chain amino acid ABC transporter permease [Mesorhizobium sp. M8A.F.Ca.ET.173.01.1.1]|nr:branched-chain amino acid ABC transporter permease [Mesorhizobium sp. M8A.F.Ca.ET.182.01.1.1]TGS78382.1 branched-chain amino acid ABC transporter permease [Mesorhizobium sp. M8A.F.Ca.ET.181.01.1.1]TGV15552.1 branched-chain amino acid ABC transporter permease [Mesorhizobium sp. M8A.F.Ca.ET.173.01.1.1]